MGRKLTSSSIIPAHRARQRPQQQEDFTVRPGSEPSSTRRGCETLGRKAVVAERACSWRGAQVAAGPSPRADDLRILDAVEPGGRGAGEPGPATSTRRQLRPWVSLSR